MKIIRWSSPTTIENLVHYLQKGKVVIGTTDTVLGLFAPVSEQGVNALNTIKKRSDKPYIVLVDCIEKLSAVIHRGKNFQIEKIIRSCWPGPLTLIFPVANATIAAIVRAPTIAIRIPNHQGILQLLSHFPGLLSTSANVSGEPLPNRAEEINPVLASQVPFLVVDVLGEPFSQKPSTIIDCSGKELRLVRAGAYPVEKVEKIYGQKIQEIKKNEHSN